MSGQNLLLLLVLFLRSSSLSKTQARIVQTNAFSLVKSTSMLVLSYFITQIIQLPKMAQ